MRRLAKQNRDDEYRSTRDYQTLHPKRGLRIAPRAFGRNTLVLLAPAGEGETALVGAGGFLRVSRAVAVNLTLSAGGNSAAKQFQIGEVWKRFGLVIDVPDAEQAVLVIHWPEGISLDIWGIAGGRLTLPDAVREAGVAELTQTHLVPETFYLDHSTALAMEIDEAESNAFEMVAGGDISLKKCSYCGRLLPVNMAVLGSLSFHKHNAKRTNHQNECRSCKKWRINDTFNPLRTTDQLHESSVITRERKLFLREPEILQRIKDRTGAGLKSQVWRRFGKKCFYCGVNLALDEVQLDHTRPLAYLWPIDEYATCLCADHNNLKKEKFPVDFYTLAQLRHLSGITGFPYEELCVRDVNEVELNRILGDLLRFAREWHPRTFAATARKIAEVRPDVDLFSLLEDEDPETYQDLRKLLAERPAPVGDEDE